MGGGLQDEAVTLLRELVRHDTANPPGNERPAQELVAARLRDAGLEVDAVGPDRERPNVVGRLRGVLPADGWRLEFTEKVVGNGSTVGSPLMDALSEWVERTDPGARCLPTLSPGYSDSRTFREAFTECIAYGFFPQRHMSVSEVAALAHGRDERIDVRDVGLAVDCYRHVAVELLG